MKTLKPLIVLALVAPVLAGCAGAKERRDRPHGPPPEAFAACEGLAEGDLVEFEGRRGETIKATCQEKDGKLVAVPEDAPEGPPPE